MKKLCFLFLCFLITSSLSACDNKKDEVKSEKPTVKIGVSLPLTGNLSALGNSVKEALLMAKEEIPADSKNNYEIIIDDDSYELRKTANNINRQISIEKIDASLSLFSGASAVIAPIVEQNHIPNISCTWGAEVFKKYKYSFNHWSKPETQAKAFIEMLKDKEVKKLAVMMVNFASTQEMMDWVKKGAVENGIEISSIDIVNKDTRDFRITIEKIKADQPQMIMLQMLDPELGIFTKQAYDMNLNIPYIAVDQLNMAQNKQYLEGTDFVLSLDGTPEFKDKLMRRSKLPVYSCAANLYDGVKMLVNIYESNNEKPTGEELKDQLYQIKDFSSALGTLISVDQDGIIDAPLTRAKIRNGKAVVVELN